MSNLGDDFFSDLIRDVVRATLEELFSDEHFFDMVDVFSIEEKMTPIIYNSIDKKYQLQMEKVKDGSL
tara:strand:+ start:539 stop:742 length:204 start_codon:yes stop_codon:yes gene_type:complete